MSLKEGDESELVLEEAQQGQQQQQQQQQQQGLEYEQVQAGNYNYAGEAAHAGEGSNPNENKWNKNGFGQGEATMTMRTGKYTKEETTTIIEAVKDYCAMKQITVSRLCSECDHKADLKGSWMEIAKCLPNRPVQSVYRHGLRQLHPFKRGAWSEGEVDMLIGFVAQIGKKWAHIQAKLNRSADSCRDKYREVDDLFIRGRWKENETEQLKRLIREYLRVDPSTDMKEIGKIVEADDIKIPWSIISKRMAKRSRLSCFKKWQKLTGLYSPSDMHRTGATIAGTNKVQHHNIINQQHRNNSIKQESISLQGDPATESKIPYQSMASDHASPEVKMDEAGDMDVYLLSELVSLDVSKASEISWEELRAENAQERWYGLLEEWQSSIMDDSLLALPISEIAQLILDRKTSAQRAAETVEAVDLPNPIF